MTARPRQSSYGPTAASAARRTTAAMATGAAGRPSGGGFPQLAHVTERIDVGVLALHEPVLEREYVGNGETDMPAVGLDDDAAEREGQRLGRLGDALGNDQIGGRVDPDRVETEIRPDGEDLSDRVPDGVAPDCLASRRH